MVATTVTSRREAQRARARGRNDHRPANPGWFVSVFVAGERALFVDPKDRRYLATLHAGGEFHTHSGVVGHDMIIGRPPGVTVQSTKGTYYVVIRPTLEDFVLEMPRGAQVIYPKDLAPILMLADVHPGVHVFETGVGSGALSMTLLRAGARITGYELREDFAARARSNVESFLGPEVLERYDVTVRDSYAGIDAPAGAKFDRMVLDLPEPWHVIDRAPEVLAAGGIVVAYTPSITQAQQVREAFVRHRHGWIEQRTLEVLHRTWHIEGQSVRPDHRMVAHTGFLTTARLIAER
jgi:tRNA (adenine57-N1/adenine58-N1)-methyltransferase